MIFGGTDVNSDVNDNDRKSVIDAITLDAHFRVCFSINVYKVACETWPSLEFKVQPQSVALQPSLSPGKVENRVIMISGIRPVKDVLFAIECWQDYKCSNPDDCMEFLIIGPIIDEEYGQKVFLALEKASDVRYVPYMEQNKLFEILTNSIATVNSSISGIFHI